MAPHVIAVEPGEFALVESYTDGESPVVPHANADDIPGVGGGVTTSGVTTSNDAFVIAASGTKNCSAKDASSVTLPPLTGSN